MKTQKRNVSEFNADVRENGGYRYTRNAPYSSRVANERITEAILAAIGVFAAGAETLIDIGCGDGTYTHDLQSRLPGVACTGFDPASEAIKSAGGKFPGMEFIVGDLLEPSTFPDRKFSVAVVRGVIHHLPDAAAGIANAARLSDKVILIEPNGNNPILKWLEKNSRYHVEHEEQSYSSGRLSEWCRRTGYTVAGMDFIGFVPFFFPAIPAKAIHALQPLLERVGPLKKYFGAQIVIVYEKAERV